MARSKKVKKQKEQQELKRSLAYFAVDGNYGDASGLVVMETTHWDNTDWDIIEEADDWLRPAVARVLTESYEKGANEKALRAKLAEYGIDLSRYE